MNLSSSNVSCSGSGPLFLPPLHSSSLSSRTNLTQNNNVAIEGRNLSFWVSTRTRQGKPKTLPILQDCSLRIPSGQFWMLLGPYGYGKSTLLKVFWPVF